VFVTLLVFLLCALLTSGKSTAQSAPALEPSCLVSADESQSDEDALHVDSLSRLRMRLDALVDQRERCLQTATYWWRYGQLARQLGRFDEASEALERAVMLEPELLGAVLDYALTLHVLGDLASAKQFYLRLLEKGQPPEIVAVLIRTRLADLQRELDGGVRPSHLQAAGLTALQLQQAQRFGLRQVVSLMRGFDSNPSNAPSVREISFTTLDGPLILALDPKDQPKPTQSWLYDARLGAEWLPQQGDRLGFMLRAFGRSSQEASQSTRGFDANLEWARQLAFVLPLSPREVMAFAGAQSLDYGGNPLVQTRRAGLLLEWGLGESRSESPGFEMGKGGCAIQPGLEFEHRHYPSKQVLNGLGSFLSARLLCASHGQRLDFHTRLGRERALDDDRPGGDQTRVDVALGLSQQKSFWRRRLQLYLSSQLDSMGYNLLIDNNKIRRIDRRGIAGEWSAGFITPGLEWVIGAERFWQSSSLLLFGSQGHSIYAGLRFQR